MDSDEAQPAREEPSTVLDSAMATGSDEGSPGESSDGPPLSEDEKELLNRLKSPDFGAELPGSPEQDGPEDSTRPEGLA
jgi:hypothetical protein